MIYSTSYNLAISHISLVFPSPKSKVLVCCLWLRDYGQIVILGLNCYCSIKIVNVRITNVYTFLINLNENNINFNGQMIYSVQT